LDELKEEEDVNKNEIIKNLYGKMNKPNMKEQQLIDREREDEIVKGLK
jgi:hypothetical protein